MKVPVLCLQCHPVMTILPLCGDSGDILAIKVLLPPAVVGEGSVGLCHLVKLLLLLDDGALI